MSEQTTSQRPDVSRSLWCAVLIGIGSMAAVDEIVFHQLLSWHHFYDHSTPAFALLTDGLLHAAELIFFTAGFFMLASLRGQQTFVPKAAWAGFFLGLGGFQLFDGIVDHKVLRLHQIRYDVDNLWFYDLAWNGVGLTLLLIGILLARKVCGVAALPSSSSRA